MVEVTGLQVSAGPPTAVARPLHLRPGVDVQFACSTVLRGQLSPKVHQHHRDVRVAAVWYAEALFLVGGFVSAFGNAFPIATAGAACRTGGIVGGCGRCIVPSTGNRPSTHRRHASANFSWSPVRSTARWKMPGATAPWFEP